jgi:phosphohistidine swiveling domain-containing protein
VVGFLTSLKNTKRLRAIDGDLVAQSKELKERLATPFSRVSEKVARQAFLEEYELIFNINLCAQRAVETLKQSLAPGQTLAQALACFPKDLEPSWEAPTGLRGNTFELSDESEFIAVVGQPRTGSGLENLPTVELKTAQEYGRWLALRHINRIRELLPTVSVSDKSVPSLPATITDRPLPPTSGAPLGVSAGQATGKLVLKPEEGGILVVSELTPELAHHAGILEGVIADHGGLLSHFAIIARELGLPVIVNYPIGELKIGSVVAMDGSTGEVIVKSRP